MLIVYSVVKVNNFLANSNLSGSPKFEKWRECIVQLSLMIFFSNKRGLKRHNWLESRACPPEAGRSSLALRQTRADWDSWALWNIVTSPE